MMIYRRSINLVRWPKFPPRTSRPSTSKSLPSSYLLILLVFNRSKREVYTFLSVDVGIFLPAYEQVSIYFLKDIVASKKRSK